MWSLLIGWCLLYNCFLLFSVECSNTVRLYKVGSGVLPYTSVSTIITCPQLSMDTSLNRCNLLKVQAPLSSSVFFSFLVYHSWGPVTLRPSSLVVLTFKKVTVSFSPKKVTRVSGIALGLVLPRVRVHGTLGQVLARTLSNLKKLLRWIRSSEWVFSVQFHPSNPN